MNDRLTEEEFAVITEICWNTSYDAAETVQIYLDHNRSVVDTVAALSRGTFRLSKPSHSYTDEAGNTLTAEQYAFNKWVRGN